MLLPLNWLSRTLGVLIFIGIPSLAILSHRGWTKGLRQQLPQWRSVFGLTSILTIFLCWCGTASLLLVGSFSDNWIVPIALLALTGTVLAFALRGASRIEAIAAGILMFAGITASVS
jgi:hypothetical protein